MKKLSFCLFVVGATALLLGAPHAQAQDVLSLVPVTVELDPPLLCGDVTVFDQEDLATLCDPIVLSSPPTNPTACSTAVSGVVKLQQNLTCSDTTGLIVSANNTIIDLNGFKIECMGAGYQGSCQGAGALPEPDVGVDTAGFSNVHVFSSKPGGTVKGFDIGVRIVSPSDNVKVKQLIITGPPSPGPGLNPRPPSQGIHVTGSMCGAGNIRLGAGNKTGNDISNHTEGIELMGAACVHIGHNKVHDNNSDPVPCHGIILSNSPTNHVRSNDVFMNGENLPIDGGITLQGIGTMGNLLTENRVNTNFGDGISTRLLAAANFIVNNQMLFNGPSPPFFDAAGTPRLSGVNSWDPNNRCITQSTPEPPAGVCGSSEAPPPE